MKEASWHADVLGPVCVLDIETAPDPVSLAMAGARGGSTEAAGSLHQITDASILKATERSDRTWAEFSITSYSVSGSSEVEVLRALDRHLSQLGRAGGVLVSYNGYRHDMPVIRRRAARHMMFDVQGIFPDEDIRHLDLLRTASPSKDGGWGKLRHVAAGLGIPVAHQVASRGIGTATPGIRKSQVDVTATFVLLLFELAMRRRCADPVILGWRALGDHIAQAGPYGEHLAPFRRHLLGTAPD